MSRFNSSPSTEYRELVNAIKEYAESDCESGESVTRAVADALEETLRESFKSFYGLDKTSSGSTCIGRLIAGWNGCNHGGIQQKGDDSGTPPHHPPHADHSELWLKDGEPAAFTMQLYDLHSEELRDVVDFADKWGLEVSVHPGSYYFSNHTSLVVFYAPELFG